MFIEKSKNMSDVKLTFDFEVDPKLWVILSQKDKDNIESILCDSLQEYLGKCVHDKIDPDWAEKMGAKTVNIYK